MSFTFIDLFAGIGGFHGALSALGGKAVYASEIDKNAVGIYSTNWGLMPDGDITLAANDLAMLVPAHEVITGGFPCQPFSKSGQQKGMDETRGTLFWNIAKIIEKRKPKLVLLENVRNLAGPRHTHEWEVIIQTLRDLGYRVSSQPFVVSPHRIHPAFGGRPQVRERIFIAATYSGKQSVSQVEPEPLTLESVTEGWNIQKWDLKKHLPLEKGTTKALAKYSLSDAEIRWIDAWSEFVDIIKRRSGEKVLPGFPIWADAWVETSKLRIPAGTPDWKSVFLRKNAELYTSYKKDLDVWLKRWNNLEDFPPSRRKLEWQAQDTNTLWDCIMHFRPSGIRAKKATYVPALVAITQTTIIGPQRRRLSVREGARLQGLPEWFSFEGQSDAASYKQLGNGVNIPAVYHVMRALVQRDLDLLAGSPELVKSILKAPDNPDSSLEKLTKKRK
jgi:DNA (cytosine-5)-methyltransferase 1